MTKPGMRPLGRHVDVVVALRRDDAVAAVGMEDVTPISEEREMRNSSPCLTR